MKAITIAAAATLAMMSTAAFAGGPVVMTDEQLDQVVAGQPPEVFTQPDKIEVDTTQDPVVTFSRTGSSTNYPEVWVNDKRVTPAP